MAKEKKEQCAPIIPDVNRDEVKNRQLGTPSLDFFAFGRFRCALKLWDFFTSDLGAHFYKAEFTVLEIDADMSELAQKYNKCVLLENGGMKFLASKDKSEKRLQLGDRVSLLFPVGRASDLKDPSRTIRDDDKIAGFIATIHKTTKAAPGYDGIASLKKLNELKKIDSDAVQFIFDRRPNEVEKEIIDPETNQVMKTYFKCFSRDSFEIVPAAA
jgi:hypothetical protein